MTSPRLFWSGFAALAALVLVPVAAGAASSVNQAFSVARSAVPADIQTRVVSIYGTGTPAAIEKWYIIFYDPTVTSHGRAVLVVNGQVAKTYPANGGAVYRSDLTFDPARLVPEGPALEATQAFAAKRGITYDAVRALLKQTSPDRPFRWRIELLDANQTRGFVYINAVDSSVAAYSPAGSTVTTTTTTTTTTEESEHHGNVESDANDFGNDVKRTFLGIGGDLQEFFTGERTVDKQ